MIDHEKVFKHRKIKLTIYRYEKLHKLETQKEGLSYIDQVKRGLFKYILIKMEAIYIPGRPETGGVLGSLSVLYHI